MIRKYWDKYKDVILYLIFGGFTTVVNIVVYWFCAHVLGTGVVDWVIMFVFVTVLHFNDMIIKILANIIVIILNFVLSKFVIFKRKG